MNEALANFPAAIKKALAQPEQKPVEKLKTSDVLLRCHRCGYSDKLTMQIEYTTPPQRTWVGLNLDERAACYEKSGGNLSKFADQLEAKLMEKNT